MSSRQPDGWGDVAYYKGSVSWQRLAELGHEFKLTTPSSPGMATYAYCSCGEWGPWDYGNVDMLTRSHWMHRTGQDNALADYINTLLVRAP